MPFNEVVVTGNLLICGMASFLHCESDCIVAGGQDPDPHG
jgi:hypothetical protein